jgi:hypothetical protein
MTTPKRNEAVALRRFDWTEDGMTSEKLGQFVFHDDHADMIAALQGEVSRLREAATNASATLSHIYHTVPLPPELEKYAHDDYQRLNAVLKGEGM